VLGLWVYPREFSAVHVNECGVVTTFHIDIGLCVDAVVNNNIESVAFADSRNSAARAVAEQLRNLFFGRKLDTVAYLRSQVTCRWMRREAGSTASRKPPSRRSTMPLATRSPETWQTSAVRVDDIVGSCGITSYVMV